ncbi:hypothetical protein RD792_006082 [Penstemon davidsonii]|uniref:LOB domain-containing protein n=1 Tax=Penstemon davidsonii TaxID=160366 RepID=A0ABR0DDJ0_9LAMI|nr:hypothetical protein RD792_006082 [Penstemon davidsonii]
MCSVEVYKKRKMSSSNSPCAACKCLRRKCTVECVFAPYFPPENPQKFTNVHKVFGASNVAKILLELNAAQREDAVNSLAYEAEYRLRDPVYGCVGLISMLQHRLKQVHLDLDTAKKELSTYIGPSAMLPMMNQPGFMQQHPNYGPSAYQMMPYNMQPMMGMQAGAPQLMIRDPQHHQHQQQQMLEAAIREQEMMRNYEQQQQQQQQHNDLLRFNSGFDDVGPVTATGFDEIPVGPAMQPSLSLCGGSYEGLPYHEIQQHQQQEHSHSQSHQSHQLQIQQHELLQQQHQSQSGVIQHQQQQIVQPEASNSQQQPHRANSEEGRSIDPSC